MHKPTLLAQIIVALEADAEVLRLAAQTAYETATAEENVAENKYDTLGLEASYLATGQARRTAEIRQALLTYRQLQLRDFDPQKGIQVSNLVVLEMPEGGRRQLFLGPDAAGLKLDQGHVQVTVITPRSPLGQQLLGKGLEDEVTLGTQTLVVVEVA